MSVPDLVNGVTGAGGIAVAGAVVAGLLALIWGLLLARLVWARHRMPTDRVVTLLAAGVALVLSADGAYRLLTRGLGLPAWEAAVVAAVAELALIAEAVRAERSIRRHGHPGGHQYAIAGIALGAGVVVSSNAQSVPEWLVRFLVPQLAALLWWMGAREDITTHHRTATGHGSDNTNTTWLVSPRRLAVQTGLIAATHGVDDLHALTRARRVRALARLLHRHTSSATVRRWRARRVHRLAETADTATITAVADQLTRTRTVLAMAGLLKDPAPPAAAPVTGATAAPHPTVAPPVPVSPAGAELVAPTPTDVGRATGDAWRQSHGAAVEPAPRPSPGAAVAPPSPGGRAPRLARPADVARVRAALATGDLPHPVTASAIAAHLGISREYASAARHALHEPPTSELLRGHGDRAGAAAEPYGPVEHPTATAATAHAAGQIKDQAPAQEALPPRAVPAAERFTHA